MFPNVRQISLVSAITLGFCLPAKSLFAGIVTMDSNESGVRTIVGVHQYNAAEPMGIGDVIIQDSNDFMIYPDAYDGSVERHSSAYTDIATGGDIYSRQENSFSGHTFSGSGEIWSTSEIVSNDPLVSVGFHAETFTVFEFTIFEAHDYDFNLQAYLDFTYEGDGTSFNENLSIALMEMEFGFVEDYIFTQTYDVYHGDVNRDIGLEGHNVYEGVPAEIFVPLTGSIAAGKYVLLVGMGADGELSPYSSFDPTLSYEFQFGLTETAAKVSEPISLALVGLGLMGMSVFRFKGQLHNPRFLS